LGSVNEIAVRAINDAWFSRKRLITITGSKWTTVSQKWVEDCGGHGQRLAGLP